MDVWGVRRPHDFTKGRKTELMVLAIKEPKSVSRIAPSFHIFGIHSGFHGKFPGCCRVLSQGFKKSIDDSNERKIQGRCPLGMRFDFVFQVSDLFCLIHRVFFLHNEGPVWPIVQGVVFMTVLF